MHPSKKEFIKYNFKKKIKGWIHKHVIFTFLSIFILSSLIFCFIHFSIPTIVLIMIGASLIYLGFKSIERYFSYKKRYNEYSDEYDQIVGLNTTVDEKNTEIIKLNKEFEKYDKRLLRGIDAIVAPLFGIMSFVPFVGLSHVVSILPVLKLLIVPIKHIGHIFLIWDPGYKAGLMVGFLFGLTYFRMYLLRKILKSSYFKDFKEYIKSSFKKSNKDESISENQGNHLTDENQSNHLMKEKQLSEINLQRLHKYQTRTLSQVKSQNTHKVSQTTTKIIHDKESILNI